VGALARREGTPRADSAPPSDRFLYSHFLQWTPLPARRWLRVKSSDPHSLSFFEDNQLPCEQTSLYFYFRTTLNVPSVMRRSSIDLQLSDIDDGMAVFVNGKLFWHNDDNRYLTGTTRIPIGPALHVGRNSVVLLLADWCVLARLGSARFIGFAKGGQMLTAWAPLLRRR
jgi:hypothetical protein